MQVEVLNRVFNPTTETDGERKQDLKNHHSKYRYIYENMSTELERGFNALKNKYYYM